MNKPESVGKRSTNRIEALQAMMWFNEQVGGCLTAGSIHPDIPTIHDVGLRERDGHWLRTSDEVRHAGFGLFLAHAPNGEVFSFDAGGAMFRMEQDPWPDGYGFSYTALRVSPEGAKSMGYDRDAVSLALCELMRDAQGLASLTELLADVELDTA